MKILQVITSLLTGGAEHLVVQITAMLRAMGHEADVAVFNAKETPFMQELEATGCRIYRMGSGFYHPSLILKLHKIMQSYDIVHTHNSSPQLYAVLANVGLNKKLVTTEHNTDNRKRGNAALAVVDRWMYGRYDKVICISDKAQENLELYLGKGHLSAGNNGSKAAEDAKIITIYNGIDVAAFRDATPVRGLHQGRFVVVMVAAFRPQKDQKTLIEALSLLPEDEYELWLVGDGAERQKLESLVAAKGMEGRVTFMGNRTDVAQVLHSADVVCMSSHYEGLSLSSLEGMSVGRPFVASDVDGLREVTTGAGVLVPHEDAKALAEAIRRLHDDKAYYQQIADSCYVRAMQFDIRKMVAAYEKVYRGV